MQQFLLEWSGIKPEYAIGCAMRFLFRPAQPVSAQAFSQKLPDAYAVIHYRVDDSAISRVGSSANLVDAKLSSEYQRNIQKALQCAQSNAQGLPILFLAGSNVAKREAIEFSNHTGQQVIISVGTPRHVDQDHAMLSAEDLKYALLYDFWALQGAHYIFAAGRLSGFSSIPASMSFLPGHNFFTPSCKSAANDPTVWNRWSLR